MKLTWRTIHPERDNTADTCAEAKITRSGKKELLFFQKFHHQRKSCTQPQILTHNHAARVYWAGAIDNTGAMSHDDVDNASNSAVSELDVRISRKKVVLLKKRTQMTLEKTMLDLRPAAGIFHKYTWYFLQRAAFQVSRTSKIFEIHKKFISKI